LLGALETLKAAPLSEFLLALTGAPCGIARVHVGAVCC
jgi:hypothetical protein